MLSKLLKMLSYLLSQRLFIYLFMRDTERAKQRYRQREKQAPLREPDVGLDPWTPGSGPEPKAELNHWAIQASLLSLQIPGMRKTLAFTEHPHMPDVTAGVALSQNCHKTALVMSFLQRREVRDPDSIGRVRTGDHVGLLADCHAQENPRTSGHILYREVTLGFANKRQNWRLTSLFSSLSNSPISEKGRTLSKGMEYSEDGTKNLQTRKPTST